MVFQREWCQTFKDVLTPQIFTERYVSRLATLSLYEVAHGTAFSKEGEFYNCITENLVIHNPICLPHTFLKLSIHTASSWSLLIYVSAFSMFRDGTPHLAPHCSTPPQARLHKTLCGVPTTSLTAIPSCSQDRPPDLIIQCHNSPKIDFGLFSLSTCSWNFSSFLSTHADGFQ